MISLALEKKKESGSQVKFEVGDVLDLPYEADSYDQVIAFGVILSHLPKLALW
jgi:ubiquinone/menaquinone biosynthesis C-methylase UbiE